MALGPAVWGPARMLCVAKGGPLGGSACSVGRLCGGMRVPALQAILANPFLAADGPFNRQLEGFVFAQSEREDNFEKTLFDSSGSLPAP